MRSLAEDVLAQTGGQAGKDGIDRWIEEYSAGEEPFPATPEGYAAFLEGCVARSARLAREREAWEAGGGE